MKTKILFACGVLLIVSILPSAHAQPSMHFPETAAGRISGAITADNSAAALSGRGASGVDPLRENLLAPAQGIKGNTVIGTGLGPGDSPVVFPKNGSDSERHDSDQFQRFVNKNTGMNLPLYGYNLFENRRYESLANIPVPGQYVVGPGDDIDLKIWGASDLAIRLAVDRSGHITIPKIGPVMVAGTRSDQLEALLKSRVGKVLSNFELSASLGRLKSIQIYVVGHARKPGMYTVPGFSTLISALFESGGPSATGSLRNVQLIREGRTVSTLDVYPFIQHGKAAGDDALMNGDVLLIPAAGPRSAVVGAVETPAVYELKNDGQTVQELLEFTGGLKVLTSPHKALIERIHPDEAQAPRTVIEFSLDKTGLKTKLQDGDLVTLQPIHPQFANAVTLRGNVAYPSRYSHAVGMRVSDLISQNHQLVQMDYYQRKNALVQQEKGKEKKPGEPVEVLNEIKNILDEVNWDYAVIERLDAKKLRPQLIPFDLGKAIHEKDLAHNLMLEPGDVVTVFGVKDFPTPIEKRTQFVRLAGEVKVPGVYQLQPKETLPDLIRRAGGLSSAAYIYATQLSRESMRLQQQENLDRAVRKLETSLSGQVAAQIQNASEADRSGIQTQMTMQKSMLERLRQLKASGRIALEMAPDSVDYPALTLEDGDSIVVPHRSDFVAVFGAVMLETSLIHRQGQTVAEFLDKAGATRDADLDGALLIKADGTVVANRAMRSWAGWGNSSFMNTRVYPGDTIFVPELLDRRSPYTQFIQGAKDWTQLLYQFGLGAVAIKTLRN